MIKDIREINFPEYATLEQATITINDMGDRSISTQVKIDGSVVPDFSYDWEVEFKGDRYIHPVRKPQGTKDNASMSAKIDMVFYHWAIYEMKRHYFVEMASTTAGTAITDKYIASLGLNLGNFVTAFNVVLKHYFGDRIVVKLNPDWQYDDEAQFVSISYSYIWDVLQQIHEIYGVRWTLQTTSDGVCEILMGYPAEEVSHIFEYGFEGGLLSVQRQVQSTEIRNRLLGRGGEKNLPLRYFKDKDPKNPLFEADPDWIPELANIAFTELRGKTFRDYVRGWKAKHYDGAPMDDPTEAYVAGYNADKFDPVEYVEDKESIAKYGVLIGALENNQEIYPSIQGVPGDVDKVVDAEQVTDDDVDASVEEDSIITNLESRHQTYRGASANSTITIETITKKYFSIPDGKVGNLDMSITVTGKNYYGSDEQTYPILKTDTVKVTIYDKLTGAEIKSSGVPVVDIPSGDYYYMVKADVETNHAKASMVTLNIESVHLYISSQEKSSGWKNTFDIWVRNIWGSSRNSGETDQQYADRVWGPILGDRIGGEAKVVFSSGWLSFSSDWEFPIVRYAYDDSKDGSYWRLTLAKSEAELEASGKYIPYEGYNASAGDRFFFIGIDMPHQYVLWAEERLDDFKRDSLLETAEIKPTWVIKTDKVRLNEDRDGVLLMDSLNAGAQIRLANKQFISGAYETLYVQSVTYKWGTETILYPDVEIVVSDKAYAVKNPVAQIQSNIETIQRQVGSLSNIQQIIRQVCDKLYLRKDGVSDLSKSPTRFLGKVTGENFRQGQIGGRDWGLYRDEQGNAILEADKIIARQGIHVNDLVINEATYVGGLQINSAASMTITAVEENGDGYVCYFDQKQGTVINKFKVNDVVLCHKFDAEDKDTKFYKARVIDIAETSVTLSKTEIRGTDIPAEDDVIIHYGSYTDKERQFVIIRDVIGGGYEMMLMDLDSVEAEGVEYYYAGKTSDGKARWFVGNRDQYVKYEDDKLQVRATLHILPGTTGLENLGSIGGQNLLRNSSFTGDYLSEELADEDVLVAESAMFSSPLDYWSASSIRVELNPSAESGYGVLFTHGGSLSQELYYNLLAGENYVLSFKGLSESDSNVVCTIGDQVTSLTLTPSEEKYVVKVTVGASGRRFSLKSDDCMLWDIQLERGVVPSSWGQSFLDNSSDRTYYQSLKYLQSALSGTTEIGGGLVLTEQISVGDYDEESKQWNKMSGGMSGVYEDDNDVAFWAGGDFEQALLTASKYENNPSYVPTDAELAAMANFIVTHGGRAILNEAIVRGKIYATSGNVGGFEITSNRIGHSNNGLSLSTSYLSFRDTDEDTSSARFAAVGENVLPSTVGIYGLSRFEAESTDSFDKDYGSAIGVYSSIKGYKKPYAYYCPYGQFAGLRPRFRRIVCPATETLEKIDHTLEVFGNNAAEGTLTLPTGPEDGQCYEIWKWGSCALTIKAQDTNIVRLGVSANPSQGIGAEYVGMVKIIFSKQASNQWLMTLCRTE